MADLLLFGRLADASRAGPRRFRCFNAHLMHTVILGLQGKLVENTSLSLRIISPRSVAQLLKHSTICKSPLHGPRNYVDHTWERSPNYSARTDRGLKQFFANLPAIFRFSKKISPYNLQQSTSHCTVSSMVFRVHVYTDTEKFRPDFTPFAVL